MAASSGKSALGIVRKYHPNVTRVVDAKKQVNILVTPEDCKGSKKKSPDHCALAQAFTRKYDGAIISLSTAYLIKGNKAIRYKVPQSISREIVSFDRHHDFAAGEYTLKAPSKTARLGPRQWAQPKNRPAGRGLRKRSHRTEGIRTL
jgi:hypothetical protein